MSRNDDPTPKDEQPRNPFHGVTLEAMLIDLAETIGWEAMGERIRIRCFTENPSVSSSLRFLRKTPWAREKVATLYLRMLMRREREERTRPSQDPPR